jgi:superoxide dismutase
MAFELPQLPMRDAWRTYIDARTMEIHHSKHHNAYTNIMQQQQVLIWKARQSKIF